MFPYCLQNDQMECSLKVGITKKKKKKNILNNI